MNQYDSYNDSYELNIVPVVAFAPVAGSAVASVAFGAAVFVVAAAVASSVAAGVAAASVVVVAVAVEIEYILLASAEIVEIRNCRNRKSPRNRNYQMTQIRRDSF